MANGLNNWKVYSHITPNKKMYIGITSQTLQKRWNYGLGYIGCTLFYNAILKYGWDNIEHNLLFDNLTEQEAKLIEIDLISKYNSNNRKYGYNITSGGEGSLGRPVSQETKQKMRDSWTVEKREKMSNLHSGKGNPMYGTICPNSKKVECITTGKIFDSLSDGAKYYDRSPASLCGHLKGNQKYAGKLENGTPLVWRYINDDT